MGEKGQLYETAMAAMTNKTKADWQQTVRGNGI
jgi:hypothetical protein